MSYYPTRPSTQTGWSATTGSGFPTEAPTANQGWSATTGQGIRPPMIVQVDGTGRAAVGGGQAQARSMVQPVCPIPRPAVALVGIDTRQAATTTNQTFGVVFGPNVARANTNPRPNGSGW